jgi:cellulose synthase/poly-beta-1,6-N-acetylglucosamine synthase-like glycosyltransferase
MQNGARALQCRYEVQNSDDSWRTNLVALAFHAFNVIRSRGRARLGLSAGVFGNGFAIHREVLAQIPYNAFSIVEDLQYHLDLVRAGYCVEFVDRAVVRGEMPVTAKGAETQRARWEGGRLQMMLKWAPSLLIEVVRGKARLIEPMLDLLSLSITFQICVLVAMAFLPFAWVRWYVAGALIVLAVHVATAAADGPGLWRTVKAITSAPGHMLWKVSIFPNIWRAAQPEAAWVRTNRETPAKAKNSKRRFTIKPIL